MHKCDFCEHDRNCGGVQRSECIVRDFFRFTPEKSPADDEKIIIRLLIEVGGAFNPTAVAKHLVKNGIGQRRI